MYQSCRLPVTQSMVGLIVAMPAMVFYNMLTDKIRTLIIEMDHFAEEYMSEVDRHFRRNT